MGEGEEEEPLDFAPPPPTSSARSAKATKRGKCRKAEKQAPPSSSSRFNFNPSFERSETKSPTTTHNASSKSGRAQRRGGARVSNGGSASQRVRDYARKKKEALERAATIRAQRKKEAELRKRETQKKLAHARATAAAAASATSADTTGYGCGHGHGAPARRQQQPRQQQQQQEADDRALAMRLEEEFATDYENDGDRECPVVAQRSRSNQARIVEMRRKQEIEASIERSMAMARGMRPRRGIGASSAPFGNAYNSGGGGAGRRAQRK